MLYTRKGDGGTTKTLHCDQRLSKSSAIAEALGAVDELNSLLGFVKVQCQNTSPALVLVQGRGLALILNQIQQNLFIIQAELAGASGKTVVKGKVMALEKIIDGIEKELPPIKTFFIPGATEDGALLDYARTVARRAERRVVAVLDQTPGDPPLGGFSLAYLNRLSSLLYALARLVNHQSGIKEEAPDYR